MAEEGQDERSVAGEFNKLGKQFVTVIRTAWESEDRKRVEQEIVDGLQKFGDEITGVLQKAADSETGKQFTVRAEEVIADVKTSDVADDVRKGMLSALEALNKELGKLSEKLDAAASETAAEADKDTTGPEA